MSATVPAEVARAEAEVEALTARLRPHFRRGAAHRHAGEYVRGLLGPVERKNGWQLAEHVGHRHPRTIQRVLDRSAWEADAVRDDLREQVIAELGDEDGVLVVDETGFLKKGTKSCGVARQYSGTAGRVENCQIGVFLGYASPKGRAGIDRALYLPRDWADDAERREEAGVPEAVAFQTKPGLALDMIERAFDAGVPARWVVGDAVYGSDGKLRRALEAWGQAYALAVKSTEQPTTWPPYGPPGQVMVADVAAGLEPDDWQRLSCGEGAQGERLYDWAYVPLRPGLQRRLGPRPGHPPRPDRPRRARLLSGVRPDRHAAHRDRPGHRRPLDHRGCLQARQTAGRPRPVRGPLLDRLASPHHPRPARPRRPGPRSGKRGDAPPDPDLVPVSVPELRRLMTRLRPDYPHPARFVLAWSRWRRHHQAIARACHIERRRRALDRKRSL